MMHRLLVVFSLFLVASCGTTGGAAPGSQPSAAKQLQARWAVARTVLTVAAAALPKDQCETLLISLEGVQRVFDGGNERLDIQTLQALGYEALSVAVVQERIKPQEAMAAKALLELIVKELGNVAPQTLQDPPQAAALAATPAVFAGPTTRDTLKTRFAATRASMVKGAVALPPLECATLLKALADAELEVDQGRGAGKPDLDALKTLGPIALNAALMQEWMASHNNQPFSPLALGKFFQTPEVKGRRARFDDVVRELRTK